MNSELVCAEVLLDDAKFCIGDRVRILSYPAQDEPDGKTGIIIRVSAKTDTRRYRVVTSANDWWYKEDSLVLIERTPTEMLLLHPDKRVRKIGLFQVKTKLLRRKS